MTGPYADQLEDVAVAARVRIERLADQVRSGDIDAAAAARKCTAIGVLVADDLDDWSGRFERDTRQAAS